MKRGNGFSVVELLAILIIIGVIALIAMPPILDILQNNRKSTFKDSAFGLLKSSEVYYTEQSMYKGGVIEDTTFTFPNSIDGLNFKGEVPDSGVLKIDSEGRVAMALYDGIYCAIKEYADGEIAVSKKSREKCQLSSLTFAYSRVPSNSYSVGSKLKYAKKNWIIIKDNTDSILVILEDVLTSSEIINALGYDLSSNDIFIYINDKRWVRHCMSNPNHYQIEENHYCYYDNDLMEGNQSYNWDRSIVKTIVDNWLNQTMIASNLNKETELEKMEFSDGLSEKLGYIRIPSKQEIEEDTESLFKKANIEYWTLTWNKNTEHYSYIWGVVTDEKLFEDKSHFLAGVRPIIQIKKNKQFIDLNELLCIILIEGSGIMKKIFGFLRHRAVLVALALLIQIFAFIIIIIKFNSYFIYFYAICVLLSLIAVLYIINNKSNPSYKMAWIIPILIFPIFGGIFYIIFGGNKLSNRNRRKMRSIKSKMELTSFTQETLKQLKLENPIAFKQAYYIQKESLSPIYTDNYTKYFKSGEEMFIKIKEELNKAEHYIFLEYFIIEEGIMWDSILNILIQKAKQGLDVRVMYDDMGSIITLPYKYEKKLEKLGIKCCVFNPFIPVLSSRINNRDHRKMLIIDGHTGFTGGINLADEYINLYSKYGYWKDSGLLIKGNAVWNLTVMFLSIWDYSKGVSENYNKYHPSIYQKQEVRARGYVQPYNDNPLDAETVGENIYLNLINNANKFIYITTPYLIVDNEMITALTLASKSGVDVRIITPGIPDKKIVNELTKSYYEILSESGIRIYEYSPGFVHAKNFIVDDLYATVGTINMDYRSLYLHFECGVWMYDTSTIKDIKNDFVSTLDSCKEIKLADCRKVSNKRKLFRAILKVLAPLM